MAVTALSGQRWQGSSTSTQIQGYNGASGAYVDPWWGSGGGGAGAIGIGNNVSTNRSNGGIGITNPITGSEVGELDSGTYYLSGGGAGGGSTSGGGIGGIGGGGDGDVASSTTNNNGIVNTGGGAGGSSYTSGAGGSGVVLVSYQTSQITDDSSDGALESGSSIPSGYAIRKFTSSGANTFSISAGSGNVQYVVVGAGGGAGSDGSAGGFGGGGGGAGGFLTGTKSMSAGDYTVTIGSGGTGGTNATGTDGQDSVFDNITSSGGGAGGGSTTSSDMVGRNGGSGGGSARGNTAGTGTSTITDEKTTVTDVPVGSEFEQTDDYKSYQYGESTVSGADLKAYYRFNEASGNIENEADQVTGNDSNGADLVVNNGGDSAHIDYEGATGTPSGLPNVASWERTSVTDGAFADANGASSLWNFLHYGDGDTNIQATICFWAKFSDIETNTMLITTTANARDTPTDIGLFLKFYSDKLYSYINVGDAGGTNNESALQAYTSTSYLVADETWHFYSMTYDWSIGSANWKVKRDNDNAESFNKTSHNPVSGNAKSPLCFGHVEPSTESMIPPDYAVADFSLWARVLTDAEITKIYNAGAGMDLETGVKLWVERGTAI